MSLLLSIETATPVCSVALHAEGQLVAMSSLHIAKSHAESLLQLIDGLLNVSRYTKEDLEAIAVSGPGSYTGLRIGVATAKGLCYSLGIPLIGIDTLTAMAAGMIKHCHQDILLCPMIDARRMEVYCLLADREGIVAPPHARVVDHNSFSEWLTDHPILFFGDGSGKCKSVLGGQQHVFFVEDIHPNAVSIGAVAYEQLRSNVFEDLASFGPMYLKPFMGGLEKTK